MKIQRRLRINPKRALDKCNMLPSHSLVPALALTLLVLLSPKQTDANPQCDATVAVGSSIQSTIDNAKSGDVVCVDAGTFNEDLVIATPHVTLASADNSNPAVIQGSSVAILVSSADSVRIQGLEIRDASSGIRLDNSKGIEIHNNLIAQNNAGIFATGSVHSVVSGNTITDNSVHGIHFSDSEYATISDNMATGNAQRGIYLTRSSNTVIENNTTSDNGQYGIFVSIESHYVTTHNNTVESNGSVGIRYFAGGENGEISDNTVSGNGDAGIQDGMNRTNHGTTITGNLVTDNEREGIDFRSNYAVVIGNTVTGNGGLFGAITTGSNSLVSDNTVAGNNVAGIRAGHGSTVRNNTVTGNTNNGIEFRISNNSTAVGNEVRNNKGVGINVSRSENAVVDSNDVSGHNADLFINDQSKNAMVRHNSFDSGVILDSFYGEFDELNHTFVDNTVMDGRPLFFARDTSDPEIPGDAGQIILVNVSGVDISGFDYEDMAAAIHIVNCHDVRIADNNFISNSGEGFSVRRAPVSVWGTDDFTVEDNTFTHNVGYAIQIYRSPAAEIAGNQISSSYAGALVTGSPRADFRQNTITGTEFRGLEIGRSDSMHVFGNVITDNVWEGIHIEVSFMLELDSNTVSDNEKNGMFIQSSDSVFIRGNTVTDNDGTGIESHFGFRSSDWATIADNTVTGNGQHGINFPADGALITGNNIRNNEIGIIVGSQATIEENRIIANSGHGLQVNDDGGDVIVAYNSIRDNGGNGLSYTRSDRLLAVNNWWGDASGPSGGAEDPETGVTADGSGDEVSSDVRFDPWLALDPFGETDTFADETENVPETFALDQNYPNPFNPSTQIRYHLPVEADVQLVIFTILGERIATLVNARRQAGSHEFSFDATHLSSGIYIYRLEAGDFVSTRKMLLVR